MDEAYKNKLWNEYAATKSSEVREQLILEYAPLVKLVAGRLSMYLGYNVEYDDLVSYGIFGLIDAIEKALSSRRMQAFVSVAQFLTRSGRWTGFREPSGRSRRRLMRQ